MKSELLNLHAFDISVSIGFWSWLQAHMVLGLHGQLAARELATPETFLIREDKG